jgi:anti-sigma regulatory factor (Ser/Thr protein kinase)
MSMAVPGGDESPAHINAHAPDREKQSFAAIPTSARAARQFIATTLRRHDAPPKVISDYALVVSELVTNLIEHGDGSNMDICLDVADPDGWEMEVVGGSATMPSTLLEPDTWTVASAAEASGRGLGIVRFLMDDIVTNTDAGQVSIRCRRRRTDSP